MQGRGDGITAPSQNVPEIHPTSAVGGAQTLLGLGPGRKFSRRCQKDAAVWRAASPQASSSPAQVFCGATSHTLASGHDIKARARGRPEVTLQASRPLLGWAFHLELRLQVSAGSFLSVTQRRGHFMYKFKRPASVGRRKVWPHQWSPCEPPCGAGRQRPRPRCPQPCLLSPLPSLALADLSEPRLEPERVCVSLRHPPSAFLSAGILLEAGWRSDSLLFLTSPWA